METRMSSLNEMQRPKPSRVKALPAPTRSLPAFLLLAGVALLLLLPAARAAANTVVWAAATHPDKFTFKATAGKQLTFTLTASASRPSENVVIQPVSGLPA